MGEREIVDELRVIISDNSGVTAYFTFSSGMRPSLHQVPDLRAGNGLLLDQDNETMIRLRGPDTRAMRSTFFRHWRWRGNMPATPHATYGRSWLTIFT